MGGKPRSQPQAVSIGKQPSNVSALLEVLQDQWGHAICELDHRNAYELLVATILAAQSTDKRVNLVTPALFAHYPSPAELARADLASLEKEVYSTGFYRSKAKNIVGMAQRVMTEYDGKIPRTMAELVTLPGVARKTANVVLGTVFGIPEGIVVDTHVKRLSGLLGLTDQTDPVKVERQLMAVLPQNRWIDFSHQIIWHGRRVCHARSPNCGECTLAPLCPGAVL